MSKSNDYATFLSLLKEMKPLMIAYLDSDGVDTPTLTNITSIVVGISFNLIQLEKYHGEKFPGFTPKIFYFMDYVWNNISSDSEDSDYYDDSEPRVTDVHFLDIEEVKRQMKEIYDLIDPILSDKRLKKLARKNN